MGVGGDSTPLLVQGLWPFTRLFTGVDCLGRCTTTRSVSKVCFFSCCCRAGESVVGTIVCGAIVRGWARLAEYFPAVRWGLVGRLAGKLFGSLAVLDNCCAVSIGRPPFGRVVEEKEEEEIVVVVDVVFADDVVPINGKLAGRIVGRVNGKQVVTCLGRAFGVVFGAKGRGR